MQNIYQNLMNIFEPESKVSLHLFNSEDFFWIATAASLGFAVEELANFAKRNPHCVQQEIEFTGSEEALLRLKKSIKRGSVEKESKVHAQKESFKCLEILGSYSQENEKEFLPAAGWVLGKTFATYWLIFKLIELEWQEILHFEKVRETYLMLDTVIMDLQDLDFIEQNMCSGGELDEDSLIYLESHWQRVRHFWRKLEKDLAFLAYGWLDYTAPYKL